MPKRLLLWLVVLAFVLFLLCAGAIVWDGLTDDVQAADVAIVLGSQVNRDGRPSRRLQARLDKAVELYRAGWFDTIIVSGGTGKTGYNEAEVMQQYLVTQGIPSEHILVDRAGTSTCRTAQNSALQMQEQGLQSTMVISQYFHIARSKLALRNSGVSPLYSAHADLFELRDLYAIAREVVAYAFYLLRG